MVKIPHPIPYQGSKRKLAPLISSYFPNTIKTFYEPFSGSAAMTIYLAYHNLAEYFIVGDILEPIIQLLQNMIECPLETSNKYREIWTGQKVGENNYFNKIRDRYNYNHDPVDLLYLICRCVKNSIRFSNNGRFTQSVDKRRLGTHPDRMQKSIVKFSSILKNRIEFRIGDWQKTSLDASPTDFIYLDPPYFGTSVGKDKRYYKSLMYEDLIAGLENFQKRKIPFALSYDGMTGAKSYGSYLPSSLNLTHFFINAGISSQSTLSGRNENTIESLYLFPKFYI